MLATVIHNRITPSTGTDDESHSNADHVQLEYPRPCPKANAGVGSMVDTCPLRPSVEARYVAG